MKKNLIAAAICGLGLLASGAASAIVIDGVNFGNRGLTDEISVGSIFETFISGSGQELKGYGQISSVNGATNYGGANSLYFIVRNYTSTNFTGTSTGFTGGIIDVYLGSTFNLLDQNSALDIATITGYTKYVELAGHAKTLTGTTLTANGTLTGSTISFTGEGFLDVVAGFGGAGAYNYLNSNSYNDSIGGLADISFSSSGTNNPSGLNTNDGPCTNAPGQYCISGSADLRSPTVVSVPEPGVLAMLGLGLMGIGASLRKRKSA